MAAEDDVYPHSSKGGVAIPFDIGDPLGTFITSFTAALSTEKTLPSSVEDQIAIIYSDANVLIRFGANADTTADTFVANQVLVLADRVVAIVLSAGLKFKMKGISGTGNLYFQFFRKWETLDKEVLQGNI